MFTYVLSTRKKKNGDLRELELNGEKVVIITPSAHLPLGSNEISACNKNLYQIANSRRSFVDQAIQPKEKAKNLLIFLKSLFDSFPFYADPT